MVTYTCDKCQEETNDFIVRIRGYHPNMSSGILLPEKLKETHFCSVSCFLEYMSIALTKDTRFGKQHTVTKNTDKQ